MNSKSLKRKLVLGTAQLGLPYGINNSFGKPDEKEVELILDKAVSEEINLLDSAEAYGDSLAVIGAYFKNKGHSRLRVISKFIGDGEPLKDKVKRTLSVLGQDYLFGYMYHRFADYRSGQFRKELVELRESGKIQGIGVSLYSNEELEISIKDPDLNMIQVPFNLLDASQRKQDLFSQARQTGKEIHVRSIFLQGLFFKRADHLTGNLKEFSTSLRELEKIAIASGLSMREICLNFALHHPHIDRVVIGVEKVEQLEENLASIKPHSPDHLLVALKAIPGVSEPLLNPSTWKP